MGFVVFAALVIFAQMTYRKYRTGSAIPSFFLNEQSKNYLNTHFSYYAKLKADDKRVFEKRVAYFMSHKKFIPRNGLNLTHDMRLLISAAAIQLTFGFPKVHLSYFVYILVYPDTYYSAISHKYHIGEVNPWAKAIVISWKYFLEGYMHQDGKNLALHEMAHALRLENRISNHEYNFLQPDLLHQWELKATNEIQRIREQGDNFFRAYAAENREEFFSVAVENFFERPQPFHEAKPELYRLLAKLLNQDPLQKTAA